MSALHGLLLLLVTYVAVFCECRIGFVRQWTLAQIDLLPALMVYAGLRLGVVTLTLVAVGGGLWFDSLSANPLGVSIGPLLVVGLLIHRQRGLILRDLPYAQFILGVLAGALAPLLTMILLLSLGQEPLLGWGTLWQWTVLALGGGVLTPGVFWLLDRLEGWFAYRPEAEPSFRLDREIKRGRQ